MGVEGLGERGCLDGLEKNVVDWVSQNLSFLAIFSLPPQSHSLHVLDLLRISLELCGEFDHKVDARKARYFRRGLLLIQNKSFDLAIRSSPSNVNILR